MNPSWQVVPKQEFMNLCPIGHLIMSFTLVVLFMMLVFISELYYDNN